MLCAPMESVESMLARLSAALALLRFLPPSRIRCIRIPPNVAESLLSTIEKAVHSDYRKDICSFSSKSRAAVFQTLEEHDLHPVLDTLQANYADHAAVLVRGLPVDPQVPPIPTDGSRTLGKETQVAEKLLLGFGQLAGGVPVGYPFETGYSSHYIHEGFVRPDGSALTSGQQLQYHMDMAYLDKRDVPHILALFCLREGPDRSITTNVLDNRDILRFVCAPTQQILREKRFNIRPPSGIVPSHVSKRAKAILTGPKAAPSLAVHVELDNVEGRDEAAKKALRELRRAMYIAECFFVNRVHLKAGDLLIFSNHRVLHSRSAPRKATRTFDTFGRVLFRAYFHKALNEAGTIDKI